MTVGPLLALTALLSTSGAALLPPLSARLAPPERAVLACVLLLLAAAWSRVSVSTEVAVLWAVTEDNGVTVADLAALPAVLAAGRLAAALRRPGR